MQSRGKSTFDKFLYLIDIVTNGRGGLAMG